MSSVVCFSVRNLCIQLMSIPVLLEVVNSQSVQHNLFGFQSSILSLFPPLAGPLRFLERFPIPPATIRPGKPKKYTTQYKTDLSVYIEYEPTV